MLLPLFLARRLPTLLLRDRSTLQHIAASFLPHRTGRRGGEEEKVEEVEEGEEEEEAVREVQCVHWLRGVIRMLTRMLKLMAGLLRSPYPFSRMHPTSIFVVVSFCIFVSAHGLYICLYRQKRA